MAQPNEPLVHSRSRIDRYLLLEDNVEKRAEPVAATAEARRTRPLQDLSEKRLGRENGDPFGEALRRIDFCLALRSSLALGAASAASFNRDIGSRHDFARAFHRDPSSISIRPLPRALLWHSGGRASSNPGGGVRAARRIMTALLAIVLALVVFGLGLRIYMGREAEDRLAAGEDVIIAELRSPLAKPSFLACPPGYCSATEAVTSPVFDLPWDRLREYWIEMIGGQKRVVRLATDLDTRRLVYIQHSPIFRFPDIIIVEFVPLAPDRSSIAVYSRSRYGEFDFANNRKRVEKWLVLVQQMARPPAPRRGRGNETAS
jgi:Protein of unknown function (DUF1499)